MSSSFSIGQQTMKYASLIFFTFFNNTLTYFKPLLHILQVTVPSVSFQECENAHTSSIIGTLHIPLCSYFTYFFFRWSKRLVRVIWAVLLMHTYSFTPHNSLVKFVSCLFSMSDKRTRKLFFSLSTFTTFLIHSWFTWNALALNLSQQMAPAKLVCI